MVNSSAPLAFYTLAEQLRVCAHERLVATSQGAPDRSCVVPGAIAWDDCECGQLAVSLVRVFPSFSFPAETSGASTVNGSSRCGPPYLVAEYNISIVRCIPGGEDDGPAPPTCAALDEAAQWVAEDAQAVRLGVTCCLKDMSHDLGEDGATEIVDYFISDQTFVGPEGLCGGSVLRVFAAVNSRCPCGPPPAPIPPPPWPEEPAITVSELYSTPNFLVAHRGSGAEAPEHSMLAYQQAVDQGAQAIEVSVVASSDGELFCAHDSTVDRSTNGAFTGNFSSFTAAQIDAMPLDFQRVVGPGWPITTYSRLQDVLDAFFNRVVIYLEAKTFSSEGPVQALLESRYPEFWRSIVWKAYYTSGTKAWAKDQGMHVWGYVDNDTTALQFGPQAALIDSVGIHVSASDAQVTEKLGFGRPLLQWNTRRRTDRAHFISLGGAGFIASGFNYLNTESIAPTNTVDEFALKKVWYGYIPFNISESSEVITFPGTDEITVVQNSMGLYEMCPVPESYRISWDMKWEVLPSDTTHSGLYLCKAFDEPYQFNALNVTGGYHVVFRSEAIGRMQLFRHDAGVAAGQVIAQTNTLQPVADTWMSFQFDVTPTTLTLRRTDVGPFTASVGNTQYRGRYFGISNGSAGSANRPAWRNVSVGPIV